MTTVTVYLAQALLCVAGQCHPALVGTATPMGSYAYVKAPTAAPGYGGSVAAFARDPAGAVYAVHRTWTGNPAERRTWRIQQPNPALRVISKGCINVAPEVYESLPDYGQLEIVE